MTAAEREVSSSPDHTHRWTVAFRSAASVLGDKVDSVGGTDDLSYFIKRVTFRLHDTYPTPTRSAHLIPNAIHAVTLTDCQMLQHRY